MGNKTELKPGDKINMIEVIRKDDTPGNKGRSYTCKCLACGKTFTAYYSQIINGFMKSCGCLTKKQGDKLKNYEQKRHAENCKVTTPNRNNKIGVRGVCFDKNRKKYMSYIEFNGKKQFLGRFNTLEEATNARKEAYQLRLAQIEKENNNDDRKQNQRA